MNKNILIVEDEPITARLIRETLSDNAYEVVGVARSAAQARELLAQHDVDIILMDINIKGVEDGIQLAQSLLDQDKAIIYISAYSDMQTLSDASDTMPYGFLVKPFKEVELLAALLITVKKLQAKDQNTEPVGHVDFEKKLQALEQSGLKLSKQELLCLQYFVSSPNRVITRDELNKALWKDKKIGDSAIRELINRIRKKVHTFEIESIYGNGYILK